jgi:transmembrane sensor
MSTQKQIDRLISQRASEWVETLKSASPAEHEAFVDWLRESRRHVAEFLTMVALERELENVDLRSAVDRPALLARIAPHVTPLHAAVPAQPPSEKARGNRQRRRWKIAAVAASAALIAFASLLPSNQSGTRQDLVADAARQRAIELADGSVVQLNAGSRVAARLTSAGRDLELLEGEALFKVAHDAQRPFRVRTGSAVVEALGTQFNINALDAETVVSVVEGRVRIVASAGDSPATAWVLGAGEEVLIDPSGAVRRSASADVTQAIAWRQQRLVFQGTPLEEVVQQFNSHNVAPKLRLEDIEPGSRHYSATFDVDDPQSFGDYLAREPDLTVERSDGEIVIRMRPPF